MKSNEPFDPIPIRAFGSQRIMLEPHDIAHPFDQARGILLALEEAFWQKMRHDPVIHGRQPERQAEYMDLFRKKRRNNSIEYSLGGKHHATMKRLALRAVEVICFVAALAFLISPIASDTRYPYPVAPGLIIGGAVFAISLSLSWARGAEHWLTAAIKLLCYLVLVWIAFERALIH